MEFKLFIESQDISASVIKYLKGLIDHKALNSSIYHFLTIRPDVSNSLMNMVQTNPQQWHQNKTAYKQLIQQLDQAMAKGQWISENDGKWIEWYRGGRKEGGKVDDKTFKRYVTVDPKDMWTVLQSLTILARFMNNVRTDKLLGFKTSMDYSTFLSHPDNIVIHYYDPNAKIQIEQAVQQFFQQLGIQEGNRQKYGRSTHGTDVSGKSDSVMIADRIVRNIDANKQILSNMNPMQLSQVLHQMFNTVMTQGVHR